MAIGHWMELYWVSHWVGADYQQPQSHWVGVMETVQVLPDSLISGDIQEMPVYFVEMRPPTDDIVEIYDAICERPVVQEIVELRAQS